MSRESPHVVSLNFPLEEQDGWPPVSVECLPFRKVGDHYEVLDAPLFIKDMSVGDVLSVTLEADLVSAWRHVRRSDRSTFWLGRLQQTDAIDIVLRELRELGCNTARAPALGTYAIDVPETVEIGLVDDILDRLDREAVAIAYPSMRHPE